MIYASFEFLRDSALGGFGALVSIIGPPLAYRIYVLQHKYKELSFGTLSSRSLLAVDDKITQRVTILLDGKPTQYINLVVLGLKNSGNMPIVVTDFVEPLTISFGENSRILSAEQTAQDPANLNAKIYFTGAKIIIAPLLINPLDTIVIQVLVSSKLPRTSIDTRIVDVHEITPLAKTEAESAFYDARLIVGFIFLMAIAMGITVWFTRATGAIPRESGLGVGLAVMGLASTCYAVRLVRRAFGRESRRRINAG